MKLITPEQLKTALSDWKLHLFKKSTSSPFNFFTLIYFCYLIYKVMTILFITFILTVLFFTRCKFQPKHLRHSSRAAVSCEISSYFLMIKYQSEKLPVVSLNNILVTASQAHTQNYRLLFPSGF